MCAVWKEGTHLGFIDRGMLIAGRMEVEEWW